MLTIKLGCKNPASPKWPGAYPN